MKILWRVVLWGFAVYGAFSFSWLLFTLLDQADVTRITIEADETYEMAFRESPVAVEVRESEGLISIMVLKGEHGLHSTRVWMDQKGRTEVFMYENEDDRKTTYVESDGDGFPDYRLVKSFKTGKVIKETPGVIVWKDSE